MKEWIGIETNNPGIIAEIDLGYICNYKCSYCPDALHSGKTWLEFEVIKSFLNKVKPASVILPGGEPTMYPHIIPLLKFLRENFDLNVALTSNGSKNIKWWKKYNHLVDVLVFTFHIEHVNVNKFIEKILSLSDKRVIAINFPFIFERFEECLEIANRIAEVCPNTYISPKALYDKHTGKMFDHYTPEQRKIMSYAIRPKILNQTEQFYTKTYKTFSDGTKELVRVQKLLNDKDVNFYGWKCWKGLQFLKVLPTGDIYNSVCEVKKFSTDKPIGTIYDLDNVRWATEPQKCDKTTCMCLTVLKGVKKEKYE